MSNGEKEHKTSLILSPQRREYLENALTEYQSQLQGDDDALEYLMTERGLSRDRLLYFRLGYVASPHDVEFEDFQGRIVIPYLTRAGVVGMKFRDVSGESKAKYLNIRGQPARIFNVEAFFSGKPYIAVTEGEIDAMTAHCRRLPTVGMPGVDSWQPWFSRPFEGYERVFMLADSDDKEGQGIRFANKIAAEVENVVIAPMPKGHDVNSFVLEYGHDALIERILGAED